jgi:acetyl-CoA carboxylase biotin carboxyl carrier protein
MPLDVERVHSLVKLLHEAGAHELVVEAEGWKIGATKGAAPSRPRLPRASAPPPSESELPPSDRLLITAPMVGIYRPGDERIEPGDRVEIGQSLGGIESMKVFNPLTSEVVGEVIALMVEDGQPVEYGHPLLEIRVEDEL